MSTVSAYWKHITAAIIIVIGVVLGVLHIHDPFTPSPHPVACVMVDPQDEPPAQDYDSHNCAGVK